MNVKQLKELLEPLDDNFKIGFESSRNPGAKTPFIAGVTGVWIEHGMVILVGVPKRDTVIENGS